MNIQNNKILREKLSAAYVLGTLRGGARRRFVYLLARSALLNSEVQTWQRRLNPLAEFSGSEMPRAHNWQQIARRLNLGAVTPSTVRYGWRMLFDNLAFWRGLGLATSTLTAVLAIILLARQPDASASFVAMLVDEQAQPNMVIVGDLKHHRLTAKILASQHVTADHSLELWAIPKQGAPISLGLLAKDGSITLPLPAKVTAQTIAMLAVSLEPLHGSPNPDGPSGPVLFKGAWEQI